LLRIADNPAEI